MTKAYFRLYHAFEIRGRHEIPKGSYLLVSNHVSFLDPPALGCIQFRDCAFMARASLFEIPVLALFLELVGCIPLRRERADRKAIAASFRYIAEGRPLIIFPEGTRGSGQELLPFKRGFIEIAAKTDIPILPVCITGSQRAWPRGNVFPRPVRITIHVGPAIPVQEARKLGVDGVRQRIADLLASANERVR